MNIKEQAQKTLESGLVPIRLEYEIVEFYDTEQQILRSRLVFETLELGVLTYDRYRYVGARTKLGIRMIRKHIQKLFEALPSLLAENPQCRAVTIPVWARVLKDGVLSGMLFEALAKYREVRAAHICIEVSADILYEDVEDMRARLDELRAMGFRVVLSEVGDAFCPVFRLSELTFDFAIADTYTVASILRDDALRVAGSLVGFLHMLGVKVIAPTLTSDTEITAAGELGFDGYSTPLPIPHVIGASPPPAPNDEEGGDDA